MGKNKSSKFFQGKEAFQRMNFLFQASEFLMTRVNQPSLAAYYGSQMSSICKKSVLRMEPRVKRQMCKGCRGPLVPGVSSRVRFNSSKNMVVTCLQCGTIKRFPMKPGYRVWVETPEACIETLTTGTGNIVLAEATKPETKESQCKKQKCILECSTVSGGKETSEGSKSKKFTEKVEPKDEGKCKQKMESIATRHNTRKEPNLLQQNESVCLKNS